MRIAFLTLGMLVACSSETPDVGTPDAAVDGTIGMDGSKYDSSVDATSDVGSDASSDGTINDASDSGDSGDAGGDAADDGSTDSGSDSRILDGGDPDGSICPPCQMNVACCMII